MEDLIEKYKRSGYIVLISFLLGSSHLFGQGVQLEKYNYGDGLRFTGDEDYNMVIRGYIQPMFEAKWFEDDSLDGAFNRFRIRRMRLRFEGNAAKQKVTWRLQFDLSGSDEAGDGTQAAALMDAWIGYTFSRKFRIRVGQKNTPTDNRELQIRSHTLQLVERSRVTSAFSTIREFGVFLDGTYRAGNNWYIRPAVAITNGDGLNVFTEDLGGLKYGARVDFLPFGTFANMGQYHEVDMMREQTPKLVFGFTYSLNQGMSSRRGRTNNEQLYYDVDTVLSLPDYGKFGFDFMFKYRGFSAVGEFVTTHASVPDDIFYRRLNNGNLSSSFTDINGNQNVENRVKQGMMLGAGYNIMAGYIFKNRISVDARYTHISADTYSFLNNGTFYNRPDYYTFGVSKYFSKMYGFKIQTSVTYVEANEGSYDLEGEPMDGNEWFFRIITSLAF